MISVSSNSEIKVIRQVLRYGTSKKEHWPTACSVIQVK